jgi:hypothetical protein
MCEIEVFSVEVIIPATLRDDLFQEFLDRRSIDDTIRDGRERAGDASLGRKTHGEVEVGTTTVEHGPEEGIDGGHVSG